MYIREMRVSDYSQIHKLWSSLPNRDFNMVQSDARLASFLNKHRGLSFVCIVDLKIVGTILCGCEDGAGVIYDIAVDEGFKERGIERSLAATGVSALNDFIEQ